MVLAAVREEPSIGRPADGHTVSRLVNVAKEEPVNPWPVHPVLTALQGRLIGARPVKEAAPLIDPPLELAQKLEGQG